GGYMTHSMCMTAVVWEPSQLGTLVTALARRAGFVLIEAGAGHDAGPLEVVCAARGLEAEPVALTGEALDEQLRGLPPGLVQVPGDGYLGVLAVHGAAVRVLTPRLAVIRLPLATLRDVLTSPAALRMHDEVAHLLDDCNIPARRRARAAVALVREHL